MRKALKNFIEAKVKKNVPRFRRDLSHSRGISRENQLWSSWELSHSSTPIETEKSKAILNKKRESKSEIKEKKKAAF